jgi:hypothetical protein
MADLFMSLQSSLIRSREMIFYGATASLKHSNGTAVIFSIVSNNSSSWTMANSWNKRMLCIGGEMDDESVNVLVSVLGCPA